MKLVVLMGALLWVLSGCEALVPPGAVEPPAPSEPPAPDLSQRVAAREILGGTANRQRLATLELWMDGDVLHPRLVLQARVDLDFYELHLALPTCYAFPRPRGEMPGWRGLGLRAGQRVEIASEWIRFGQQCPSAYATVLWQIASRAYGSKGHYSVLWQPPQD